MRWRALAAGLDRVDVLVNNAGGARGLEPVAEADVDNWRWMWESNVLGTLLVTRALLPKLIESGDGLIITVTSIAAVEIYDNGGGYTSAKHAQGVLHRTLRSELLGKPVRLTEVAPGMVQTEFSLNRFDGDEERAAKVYEGRHPAGGRGHRRGHRVRRRPAFTRRPGSDRGAAARPGQRRGGVALQRSSRRGGRSPAAARPTGWPARCWGCPDGGAASDSADIDFHSSHGTAQSQMSPSA